MNGSILSSSKPAASSSSSGGGGSRWLPALPSAPLIPLPAPIRRLFASFPLQTLPPNALPSSASSKPTLYVFSTAAAAARGAPSFNPSCLKWQTWLALHGVEVALVPSNNHASPSGALPFLLVPAQPQQDRGGTAEAKAPPLQQQQQQQQHNQQHTAVTAGQLLRWAPENAPAKKAKAAAAARNEKQARQDPKRPAAAAVAAGRSGLAAAREAAYLALVEHRLRAAWLHSLYLTANFDAVAVPWYVQPASSAAPVRFALSKSLRAAAREALYQISPVTRAGPRSGAPAVALPTGLLLGHGGWESEEQLALRLYQAAREALAALAVVLGEDRWFFGAEEPGHLDVALFAYTHLLLDASVRWQDTRLVELVHRDAVKNLVRHRDRLYVRCFQGTEG